MSSPINAFKKSDTALNLCVYALLCYFTYHVLTGERGLFSYLRLNAELHDKQEVMEHLKSERMTLEKKVDLMSTNSIDYDTLDEIARKNLGLIAPDEELLVIKDPQVKIHE